MRLRQVSGSLMFHVALPCYMIRIGVTSGTAKSKSSSPPPPKANKGKGATALPAPRPVGRIDQVNNDDSWGDWCSTGKRLTDADNDASWGSWGSRGTSNTWPSASDGGSYDYDNGNWSISTKQEGKRNIPDKTWVDRDWQWPDQYGSRRH